VGSLSFYPRAKRSWVPIHLSVGSKLFLQHEHGRDLFVAYLKYIIIIGKNQLLMKVGSGGLSEAVI